MKEHEAARHRAALADVSAWGKLIFKGPDCKKFLHGLLTNDIQSLRPGCGLPTCVLTPKGKLIADFALYDLGGELLSVQFPQATAGIASALSKPLILSQTTMEDVTHPWAAFLIIGSETPHILKEVLNVPQALDPYACARLGWKGESLILLSFPALSPEGILLLADANKSEKLQSNLLEKGSPLGLERMGPDTFETLRIEAGVPVVGLDTDEDTLPLELPLDHAISFTKGCYMGQETTARIKNFGHVNRKWVGFKIHGETRLPAEIFLNGKSIGKITSVAQSPRLNSVLGLGFIRSEHAVAGTQVLLRSDGVDLPAEVVGVPL